MEFTPEQSDELVKMVFTDEDAPLKDYYAKWGGVDWLDKEKNLRRNAIIFLRDWIYNLEFNQAPKEGKDY